MPDEEMNLVPVHGSQFMVFQTSWDAFLASLFSTLNREP